MPRPLGVNYTHPRKGTFEAAADPRVIAACNVMYTDDDRLMMALSGQCGLVSTLKEAGELFRRHFSLPELVVGVSGYASRGYPCAQFASALSLAYQSLMSLGKPSLACDGATGAGILGLNGIVASRHGIPTLGFAALQGLASMAPRTHMVVDGHTYRGREELVGSAPDLLMCFGGGDGSLRECLASLRAGGSVLAALPVGGWRSALAGPWVKEGRLVFCDEEHAIPEAVGRAVNSISFKSRTKRLRIIRSLLGVK